MIEFELKDKKHIRIMKEGKEIGRIFTPSGSGEFIDNGVQICGFSEAFDLWGCGPYRGFKDIQLLFDGKEMGGESRHLGSSNDECMRCFMTPCQCEVKSKATWKMLSESDLKGKQDHMPKMKKSENPFTVKREHDLKDRLIKAKKKD